MCVRQQRTNSIHQSNHRASSKFQSVFALTKGDLGIFSDVNLAVVHVSAEATLLRKVRFGQEVGASLGGFVGMLLIPTFVANRMREFAHSDLKQPATESEKQQKENRD